MRFHQVLLLSLTMLTIFLPVPAKGDPGEPPRLPPDKIASLMQRFAGVKQWEISYHFESDNPHRWVEGGTQHHRTQWREASHGSFVVSTEYSDDGVLRLEGRGPSFDEISIDYQTALNVYRTTRYDRGAGMTTCHVDFTLYFETGIYEASFSHGDLPTLYGGSETNAFETRTYGPVNGGSHVTSPHSAPAHVRFKLPEEGFEISGSWSFEALAASERRLNPGQDWERYPQANQTRGHIEWTLRPVLPPLAVELHIEALDADDWLPQGRQDERTPANDLSLKATLVSTDGKPLQHHAVEFRFSLAAVSREPGVALNWPLTGATTDPDLQFVAARNAQASVDAGGLGLRVTGERLSETTVALSAFDWGAFGEVEVTAKLDNGRSLRGRVKTGGGERLRIPLRQQGGAIGDAWRRTYDFVGADGDDADTQEGNHNPGDGLTAYEEYRGLVLGGKHSRQLGWLTPAKKDLVVINELGAEAKAGLALFENASGIRVVEARPGEFPESRQVNLNRGTATGGAQHGLRLVKEKLAGEVAGENRPAHVLGKTPKRSDVVVIDPDLAREYHAAQAAVARAGGVPMPYTAEEDIANTVAHEIAHGVGAPHHGKTSEYFGPRKVTTRMTDYPVYGSHGTRVPVTEAEPYELKGRIGRPGNEASGDLNCIMAYPNFYQWAAVGRTSGPFKFYAIPPQPLGRIFCTSSTGTRFNQPQRLSNGASLPAFFGPAAAQGEGAPQGNCLGAMHVRDW